MNLTVKVIVGMVLGILVGVVINLGGFNEPGGFVADFITGGLFFVIGKLFVNALTMMVVPLVLFSLICGVCGIGDVRLLGKIGGKSFLLYLMTTAIAIGTAIVIAGGLGIGQGMEASSSTTFTGREAPPLTEVLINIIPRNPINAMSQGEMLSVIFFAILFGVSLLLVGRKATKLIEIIEILNEAMMKMVTLIMAMAPYAVFCLLAKAMAELGLELLGQLIAYVLVLVIALLVHLFVTQQVLLKSLSGLSPRIFLKKIRNVQVFAFSTSSSNATIPVTLRTVTERMGVNNSVASFTVPFGATINMDGTAIMQGVATVFIANMYGVDLGVGGYLTVIMMSV
ncbi:MAG: dicarboxylate/amino acid:cation symporter, partial [Limnobacter sp.]|nr:dicarboxylate/amino acid:cation symporter [Limnobacter sp.]